MDSATATFGSMTMNDGDFDRKILVAVDFVSIGGYCTLQFAEQPERVGHYILGPGLGTDSKGKYPRCD